MSYPLIILGAGASRGFLERNDNPNYSPDLDQYIPPVTNELFDGARFHELITKYPEMSRLVDYIRARLRNKKPKTLEQILSDLFINKVKVDKSLYVSFMALLFYVSDLFGTITEKYYRPNNNYGALIKMLGFVGNKAIFVNFNYDLLFERSLGKSEIKNIDELIKGDFPVIKIHGASNWYWARQIELWGDENKNCYQQSLSNAETLINISESVKDWQLVIKDTPDPKSMGVEKRSQTTGYSYHPTLALPIIEGKNYVCPESHINLLTNKLSEIDRIVIIGWKLGDPFLNNLISQELKKREIPVAFIGGKSAKDVVEGFDEKMKMSIKLINDEGFSDFLSSDECEEFFSDETTN